MSRPLYILRAERDAAGEKLVELLSWHVDAAELEARLDDLVTCNGVCSQACSWIDAKIDARDRRSRGQMLAIFADLLELVDEGYAAERREAAELIACGGKIA